MEKERVWETVDRHDDLLEDAARRIWETPELGLQETESAKILIDILEEAGFDVRTGVGGMPTAFVATYGSGRPHLGLLAEYDALPGLSQEVSPEREPVEPGGPGHGCGHNLFGVGCLGAALALAGAIDDGSIEGRISVFGCPAEETLVGKVYMARDAAFDDLDAALTWHPSHLSAPFMAETLAMNSILYEFEGESAHAADSPEAGRSALDGVELMNTGAEFMREHVSDDARVHYTIPDGGGAPNVVPSTASAWYFVRAPTREEVDRITAWLDDVAEGAALMTQTTVERRLLTGCYDYRANGVLSDLLLDNMRAVGEIPYDDADREFAAELKETLSDETVESRTDALPPNNREAAREASLFTTPLESFDRGTVLNGSTDVGDVSWIVPVGQFWTASWPVGTPAHTWQAVVANGSFATRSAVYAAKVLSGAAYDLFTDRSILGNARDEFEESVPDEYETPLPASAEPPFDVTSQ